MAAIVETTGLRCRVGRKELAAGLAAVSRFRTKKNTIPVLAGTLLTATGNRLTVATTDPESYCEVEISADVHGNGGSSIAPAVLLPLVRQFQGEEVTLSGGCDAIRVTADSAQYDLAVAAPPEMFPQRPEADNAKTFTISTVAFKRLVRKTAFYASTDDMRPYLTGISFTVTDGQIRALTTQGVAIATATAQVDYHGDQLAAIIPATALDKLMPLIGRDPDVRIDLLEHHVIITSGPVRLTVRVLDGAYPDVMRLVPKEYTTTAVVSPEALRRSVTRCALVARDGKIKLSVCGQTVTAEANTHDDNGNELRSYELLPAKQEGADLAIGFDSKFLLPALAALDTETVTMEFDGSRSPARITPVGDNTSQYVVLPLITY